MRMSALDSEISMKRFFSNNEAAEYIGTHPTTMPTWRNRGKGPAFIRLGRKIAYALEDLDAWLAANRTEPAPASSQAEA